VTIHSEHPFLDAEPDPVRRFRGRLGSTVTLWTTGPPDAGLTVSSVMVAAGDPAQVVALLDPDSDLHAGLLTSGRAVLHQLAWRHRGLAEVFAETAPAPGGKFAQATFLPTSWGPRLTDVGTWAGLVLVDSRPLGWSELVTCRLDHVEVGDDDGSLLHRRGRFEEVLPKESTARSGSG
jgi:flavin reductase (DIM6/NTAB) family NADH-FMN oxidoreductase RutF